VQNVDSAAARRPIFRLRLCGRKPFSGGCSVGIGVAVESDSIKRAITRQT